MAWGGKRAGAGRPMGSTTTTDKTALSVQVAVRLTVEEKADLERRAKEAGLTVSRYIYSLVFPG